MPTEDDPEQLWVCIDQLRDGESQLFPEPILQALSKTDCVKVINRDNDELTLHKLPQPWDLPVIFAVRISMSLPALFQAVRLYRIREPGPVQDDFGRTLIDQGEPLHLPLVSAQELWFSDGGITSNFPVHFFDNSLPRWPTVSLNLGTHPEERPIKTSGCPRTGMISTFRSRRWAARAGPSARRSSTPPCRGGTACNRLCRVIATGSPKFAPARARAGQPLHAAGDHRLHGFAALSREHDCVRGSRTMRSGIASVGCGCVPP